MLYRFILGNIASFADQVQFDMFPNPKREIFAHHVCVDGQGIAVLKGCALYGANGSGKSNFIYALRFVKRFATEFNLNGDSDWIPTFFRSNQYKLPIMENTPMSFLIEFGNEHDAYIYTFEIAEAGVLSEKLYRSGLGKTDPSILLERDANKLSANPQIFTSEIVKVIERQLSANPSQSVLSIVGCLHLIENVHVNDAFDWLANKLEIIEVGHQIPWLIDQLSRQPHMMEFVKEVFTKVGLGIQDMSLRSESFDDWAKHACDKYVTNKDRQFPFLSITEEDGIRTVKELLFHQLGKKGYIGTMECETQSTGTLNLLSLIPAIYYAVYQRKTIVVDEVDNSIHPILIKEMIKLFENSSSNGQLIFTTNETALLNQQELLRPDEVWLIEKKEGTSNMYSLNDFKIHKTLSLENGYLEGRFGAIPFLGAIDILKSLQ